MMRLHEDLMILYEYLVFNEQMNTVYELQPEHKIWRQRPSNWLKTDATL